jgi:hypothetical protein
MTKPGHDLGPLNSIFKETATVALFIVSNQAGLCIKTKQVEQVISEKK